MVTMYGVTMFDGLLVVVVSLMFRGQHLLGALLKDRRESLHLAKNRCHSIVHLPRPTKSKKYKIQIKPFDKLQTFKNETTYD